MQSRKSTAWRKNKYLGQIKGGRTRMKPSRRRNYEYLQPPAIGAELPIYIEDNPSKDFYFPLSINEIKQIWDNLPKENLRPITHIWLHKISPKEFNGFHSFGLYICNRYSTVNTIQLFAWPKDRIIRLDKHRPSANYLRLFNDNQPEVFKKNDRWCLRFTEQDVKDIFTNTFLHEVGHHADACQGTLFNRSYNGKEDVAENYVKHSLLTLDI